VREDNILSCQFFVWTYINGWHIW